MIYLLAYKLSDGKKGLAISKDNCFVGTENLEEAKKLIPNWNGYHAAGNTWSTSATLYWAAYHPHIVSVNDMQEVADMVVDLRMITTQNAVWGSARYTFIKDETELNVAFDPRLIDEGVDTAKPFWEK